VFIALLIACTIAVQQALYTHIVGGAAAFFICATRRTTGSVGGAPCIGKALIALFRGCLSEDGRGHGVQKDREQEGVYCEEVIYRRWSNLVF
jgi:hypothetical protein